MKTRRIFLVATLFVVVAGCSVEDPPGSRTRASLRPGVAALVGTEEIDLETVIRVARASEVPLRVARDRSIFDALLGLGAKERFGAVAVKHAERSAAARRLLEGLMAEARVAGSPSDAEVDEITETRWWEVNRPALRRTTHAVVVVEKPEEEKPARALADRVSSAVASATDAASFRSLATGAALPGVALKVEDLDPVAADGRVVNPVSPPPVGTQTGRYSPAFAAAVFAVPGVHRVSPVVRTEFGFHVIMVTEIFPEQRIPLEERRRLLESDVFGRRASKLERETLERARAAVGVAVERSALHLTEKVNVSP